MSNIGGERKRKWRLKANEKYQKNKQCVIVLSAIVAAQQSSAGLHYQ